jgi:enoyl-CoA hydratase
MSDTVLVTHEGAVTVVTINRPEAFNALDAEVLEGLAAAVEAASDDVRVRAVVVTGSGDRAFCAGADLKELRGMDEDAARTVLGRGQEIFRTIEKAPVPVVAAVNGLALGGGFELVLACTFSVVSTRASLGLPETGLGLIPGYGGTQRLQRTVGRPAAAHLMLTGTRLDAARAHALGLTPVEPVAPDALMTTALDVAQVVARQGPEAVRSVLAALDRGRDLTMDESLGVETLLAAQAVGGDESSEGVAAFLEGRAPDFDDRKDQ